MNKHNTLFPGKIWAILLFPATLASCALINLAPFDYTTYPQSRNQSLPEGSLLRITFNDPIEYTEAEDAVKIRNDTGVHECDYSWESNTLVLTPKSPWIQGIRYKMIIQGEFHLKDSRKFTVKRTIPFFIGPPAAPPALMRTSFEQEDSIERNSAVVLTFSSPMDTESFEKNISLSPDTEKNYSWNTGKTEVTLTPQEAWKGLTRYTLTLSEEIKDERKVPLIEEYRLHFRTFNDTAPPNLIESCPWSISNGAPLRALDLNDLNNNNGIFLEFSEAVRQNADSLWTFSPDVQMHTIAVGEAKVALIPEEPWIPGKEYILTISKDLADTAGNTIGTKRELIFTPSIPVQRILNIRHNPADPVTDLSGEIPSNPLPVTLSPGAARSHSFELELARPITAAMLPDFIKTLSLSAVFPSTVTSPALSSISLTSPTRLMLIYSGFSQPDAGSGINHYYRFKQNADRDGTMNSEGSYVTDALEITFIIEAAP